MQAVKALENDDIESDLALLGLNKSLLTEAISLGFLAKSNCTAHHPRTYKGLVQWGETVKALRDILKPLGWKAIEENNYSLCVNSERTIAIVIQTGDQDTGLLYGNPTNKASKGNNTEESVKNNQMQQQLSLFPASGSVDSPCNYTTWVLLYTETAMGIRCELSLPVEMVDGKITSWHKRIVIGLVRSDSDAVPNQNDLKDIDIEIKRKS
jgi:hypothetical protein